VHGKSALPSSQRIFAFDRDETRRDRRAWHSLEP